MWHRTARDRERAELGGAEYAKEKSLLSNSINNITKLRAVNMKLMAVDERWVTSTTPLDPSHIIIINRREGKKLTEILKSKISVQVNNRIRVIIRLEFNFGKQRRKERGSLLATSFKKALGLKLIFNWLSESVSPTLYFYY